MKKRKIKKFFKEINAELARFDNRLDDLEKNELINVLIKPWPILEEPKEELKELPEKWCVKHSTEALKWIRINAESHGENIGHRAYYFYPNNSARNNSSDLKPDGYTEISFSDFERLVLKKETETKLEIGRWYKTKTALVCYQGAPDKDQGYPTFKGYGFSGELWIGIESDVDCYNGWTLSCNWIPATGEEVEVALINEAKRRYKRGDVINGVSKNNDPRSKECKLNDDNFYVMPALDLMPLSIHGNVHPDDYEKNNSNPCIFENGIWADIIEQSEEMEDEIDFSVSGQLVIAPSENAIVLTTGLHNKKNGSFQGITVSSNSSITQKGEHWKGWAKDGFKLFKGSIELKN